MDDTLDLKPEDRIEYWKLVMGDFEESNLTRREYCEKNEIKLSTFDYWKRRLSELEEYDENHESRFAELRLSQNEIPVCDLNVSKSVNSSLAFKTEMIIGVGDISLCINESTPIELVTQVIMRLSNA